MVSEGDLTLGGAHTVQYTITELYTRNLLKFID